jgi:hypothetical protein
VWAVHRSAPAASEPGVRTIVLPSVRELASLATELEAADVVLSCLGNRRTVGWNPWSPMGSPHDLVASHAAALSAWASSRSDAHRTKRVITISAAGVREGWSRVSWPLRLLIGRSTIGVGYRDLGEMESILEQSSLDWTAVRPTTLLDTPATGTVRVVEHYRLSSRIPRADVATYMLDLAEGRAAPSRTPTITSSP